MNVISPFYTRGDVFIHEASGQILANICSSSGYVSLVHV